MNAEKKGAYVAVSGDSAWKRGHRAFASFGGWWVALAVMLAAVVFPMFESMTAIWTAVALLFSGLLYMCEVIRTGLASRVMNVPMHEPREKSVKRHRRKVAILTGFLLVGFVGIETVVRKEGGQWGSSALVFFHLILAGCTAMMFISALVMNGKDRPEKHWKFAYFFLGFYIAVFITGTTLAAMKFPLPDAGYTCSSKLGSACVVDSALPIVQK